ncbi:MAG: hypothetical protein R2932_43485 [Caldilineaceae bacterium]
MGRHSGQAANGVTLPGGSQLPSAVATSVRWLSLLDALLPLGTAFFRYGMVKGIADLTAPWQSTIDRGADLAMLAALVALLAGGWQQMVIQADQLGNRALVGTLLLQTRTGHLMLARQLLVIFLLVVGLVSRRRQRQGTLSFRRSWEHWVALSVSLLVLGTFSLGSHAAAVAGSGWAILVDYVHLVAAALWLGGLWTLATFSGAIATDCRSERASAVCSCNWSNDFL